MLTENSFMLEQFAQTDKIFYYNSCTDISLAGDDYKVNKIKYLIKSKAEPLSDYIAIKHYSDDFLLLYVFTKDESLIKEAAAYLAEYSHDIGEIELRTPYSEVFGLDCLSGTFDYAEPSYPISPVFYIRSLDELTDIPVDRNVQISFAEETDKVEIEAEVKSGHFNSEEIGVGIFNTYTFYKDTKLFLLRVKGAIAGYLRAECGYLNIYDIGWLYVIPECRGHNYAAQLTQFFSRYCFDNGMIPHYGYAVSDASARVAEKCGYRREYNDMYCKRLIRKER